MDRREERTAEERSGGRPARRIYERPRIVTETVFETTALACGKIAGQGGKCNVKPKTS